MKIKGLSPEEFDSLLLKLDPDRERAGEVYLLLWEKLTTYFQLRSCSAAEELADETLTRVAKKISIGEDPRNISAYCYGFAKMILLEYLKRPALDRFNLDEQPREAFVAARQLTQKEQQRCFDKCLRQIPVEEAEVLIQYWCNEKRPLREVRKELAERLGISTTALRIRVHRIKQKLEACTKKCLGEE